LEIKNNPRNADLFKRQVRGARLARGMRIPNKNILNLNISESPKVKIIANVQGSANNKYIVNIFEDSQNAITIVHDCPDFRNGYQFCKHIIKILLVLEEDLCKKICHNLNAIKFTSNFNLVKETRLDNHILKADKLIKEDRFIEAIDALHQAFEESKNAEYLKRILEISLQAKLYHQFMKYVLRSDHLFASYKDKIPTLIKSTFNSFKDYSFQDQVNTLNYMQEILLKYPKNEILSVFREIDVINFRPPLLRYFFLRQFYKIIYLDEYFRDVLRASDPELKKVMAKLQEESLEEDILNFEPKDLIEGYEIIALNCQFSNNVKVLGKINDYKGKLNELYITGLKLKHAFLRSLVISNYSKDTLRQMNFTKKYYYPSLIWASAFRKESPLHYYIIEKCGLEKHHLEYLNLDLFIENFPVFSCIFSGNNPVPQEIKNFWGKEDPKIENTVFDDELPELDFEIDINEIEEYVIIEWDLAQKPILGSYICQFSEGFLIPDPSHPLTHELKPFDLTLCFKAPISVKRGNIKIHRPIKKINIKTAIELAYKEVEFITSYLPFDVIKKLKNHEVDELDALFYIKNLMPNLFSPKKQSFIKHFKRFVENQIKRDLNEFYLKIIGEKKNREKILKLLGFEQYESIFKKKDALKNFKNGDLKRKSLQELKLDFQKSVSRKLVKLIQKGNFEQIDIKILKRFPRFKQITAKIIFELKKQLENCVIYQIDQNRYDLNELADNYYGNIILQEMCKDNNDFREKKIGTLEELNKILENFDYLKLQPPKIETKN